MDVYSAVFIPVLIGLTQVAKLVGLPDRALPIFVIALGLGLAYYSKMEMPLLNGLVMALSSMGLYSGAKKTLGA